MSTKKLSAHTPGPWKFGELSREVITLRGRAVAAPPESDGPDDDAAWEVDARLIAAAPDMLAALRAALEDLEFLREMPATQAQIRAVLAKAGAR